MSDENKMAVCIGGPWHGREAQWCTTRVPVMGEAPSVSRSDAERYAPCSEDGGRYEPARYVETTREGEPVDLCLLVFEDVDGVWLDDQVRRLVAGQPMVAPPGPPRKELDFAELVSRFMQAQLLMSLGVPRRWIRDWRDPDAPEFTP